MPDPAARARVIASYRAEQPDGLKEIGNRYLDIADDLVGPMRQLLRQHGEALAREAEHLRAEFAPPAPLTLNESIAIADDLECNSALVTWLDAPGGKPRIGFDRQPDTGRTLWVLAALMISTGVDGMTHFLNSSGIGKYFSFYNQRRPHTEHGGETPETMYFNNLELKKAA